MSDHWSWALRRSVRSDPPATVAANRRTCWALYLSNDEAGTPSVRGEVVITYSPTKCQVAINALILSCSSESRESKLPRPPVLRTQSTLAESFLLGQTFDRVFLSGV